MDFPDRQWLCFAVDSLFSLLSTLDNAGLSQIGWKLWGGLHTSGEHIAQ